MIFTALVATTLLLADFLAADSAGGADPLLPPWGQLGVLGLLVMLFLFDRIVTGAKYDQMRKERDAERQRTEEAERKLEEKFLPALLDTQLALRTVNDETLPVLKALKDEVARLKAGNDA